MSIQFTQYLLPDGRKQRFDFYRPEHIEKLSRLIMSQGGYFDIEVLRTGETSLTAEIEIHGEVKVLAIEIVNTISIFKKDIISHDITEEALRVLGEAVDKLIIEAYQTLTDSLGLPRTRLPNS